MTIIQNVSSLCTISNKVNGTTVWYLPLPSHINRIITLNGCKYRSEEAFSYMSDIRALRAAVANIEVLSDPSVSCQRIIKDWARNFKNQSVKLIFSKEFTKESQLLNTIRSLQEIEGLKCFIEIDCDRNLVSKIPTNIPDNILVLSDQYKLRDDIPVVSYSTDSGIDSSKFYPEDRIDYVVKLDNSMRIYD